MTTHDGAITKQHVSQLSPKYKGSIPTIKEIEAERSDSRGGQDA